MTTGFQDRIGFRFLDSSWRNHPPSSCSARVREKQLDELDRPASLGGWDPIEFFASRLFRSDCPEYWDHLSCFPACAHSSQTFLLGVNAKLAASKLLAPAATGRLLRRERGTGSDGVALCRPGVVSSQLCASAWKHGRRIWNMTFCLLGEAAHVNSPAPAAVLQAGCAYL